MTPSEGGPLLLLFGTNHHACTQESTIFVEMTGGSQMLSSDVDSIHADILGITGERPIMQIGGQVFAGQYEEAFGTLLLMENEREDRKETEDGNPSKCLSKNGVEYFCKTDKKLVMKPAFLVEKSSGPDAQKSTSEIEKQTTSETTPKTNSTTTSSP